MGAPQVVYIIWLYNIIIMFLSLYEYIEHQQSNHLQRTRPLVSDILFALSFSLSSPRSSFIVVLLRRQLSALDPPSTMSMLNMGAFSLAMISSF